jgi:hypothetical protein
MKKYMFATLVFFLVTASQALAQEHYTEGAVWQVSLVRVRPNQNDAYFTSLRQRSKPLLEEEKKEGIILDYKFFLNTTKHDREDWDVALAVLYKNFAALDGLAAKTETVRDKIFGSKQAALSTGEKRLEMRELVQTMTLREINLK